MSNWDDEIFSCSICKTDKCVLPSGPSRSNVLIIAPYPSEKDGDIRLGRPMCGPSGGVLREELMHNGIDIKQIRICNMWYHEPNKNPDCFQDGVQRAIAEAKDRKFILLIGAETAK
jgi:uracil-DNA glycosylase family 4